MRRAAIALLALLAGPAAAQPAAGFQPFETVKSAREGAPAMHCTADLRWCAEASQDVDTNNYTFALFAGRPTEPTTPAALHALPDNVENAEISIWPKILPLADGGLLVGLESSLRASYSGGGGSATTLHLLHVALAPAKVREVWSGPLSASLSIRACFGEADHTARRGACEDRYGFTASLTVLPGGETVLPPLSYRARATAYPADASRGSDSTQRPPLKASDLREAVDPRCSFSRTLRYSKLRRAYVPDAPAPDCSDYTEP